MISFSAGAHPDLGTYEIRDDLITMPLWTKEFCAELVDFCNQQNQWIVDKSYNTEEVWLKELDPALVVDYGDFYKRHVLPIIHKEWVILDFHGLMSPFILKYTMDGSRFIRNHSDFSIVTLHVKLNDRFTDGDVVFPRQGASNKDVEVGHAVLFPSMVTHPHYSNPITSGERYAFVSFTWHSGWDEGQRTYAF